MPASWRTARWCCRVARPMSPTTTASGAPIWGFDDPKVVARMERSVMRGSPLRRTPARIALCSIRATTLEGLIEPQQAVGIAVGELGEVGGREREVVQECAAIAVAGIGIIHGEHQPVDAECRERRHERRDREES